MFEKLKSLIFGLGEFEKSKIEVRFLLAKEISLSLKIKKLEEFEILESCIYKIRELLRLKSSNLNKAISDSSRNIKKREVIELLEILDSVKNSYLKETESFRASELQSFKASGIKKENGDNGLGTRENKKEEGKKQGGEEEFAKNIEIISKPEYEIMLGIEKIPYVLINFKSKLDFGLLKKVMVIFFEVYMPQGTNIIIEGTSVLILPRFAEDNLISFPTLNVDIENVYDVLQKNKLSLDKNMSLNQGEVLKDLKEKKKVNPEDIYVELKKKPEKKSLKQKEESLDNLLEALNKKTYNRDEQRASELKSSRDTEPNGESEETRNNRGNDNNNNNNSNDDDNLRSNIINSNTKGGVRETGKNENSNFEIISDDSVEVIKKSKEDKLRDEIIIEPKIVESKVFEPKNIDSKLSTQTKINVSEDLIIYKDEKIIAYVNDNSKSFGEVIVCMNTNEKISNLSESDLSYLIIFSKVFSQVLFNEAKSEGSNMIFDYSSNKIRIISRKTTDELANLSWQLKESSEDFLEQVKAKLFAEMSKGIERSSESEGLRATEPQSSRASETRDVRGETKEQNGAREIGIDFYDNGKGNLNNKKIRREIEEVNSSLDLFNELSAKKELKAKEVKKDEKPEGVIKIDTALEKKAKYILEALRRIP